MNRSLQQLFRTDNFWGGLLLLLSAIFFVILAIVSTGDYGGADTYWHYFISHYAFRYPGLFLHHWGKPLFTALSSPFSYFGFLGLKLFNVIVSLISAGLAWQVGKKLGLQYSWLAILLTLFAPVYFMVVFSGLTENLCGLVLVWAVYLFFNKRYALAAIVISFIPYARTEGFIFLPLFALALAWYRRWPHLLLLFTGFLFYSIIGYFYYHDFFWTFNQNPYGNNSSSIYGNGSLWSFASQYRELFGLVFTALLLVGIIEYLLPFFRRWNKKLPVDGLLLIMLPVVLYFAAHSYVWWKGTMGSAGLTRVMAAIIPLAAVLGLKGFNVLAPLLKQLRYWKLLILLPLCGYILYEPLRLYPIPFPTGSEEKVLDETARWIKKEKLDNQKLYCLNAYLFFKLNYDLHDNSRASLNFPSEEQITDYVKPGELVVWDSHFGPNEGRLDVSSLMNNQYFLLRAVFLPDQSFFTMGGRPYEVYVFQRVVDTAHIANRQIFEDLKQSYYTKTTIYLNEFSGSNIFAGSQSNNSCLRIMKDVEFPATMDTLIGQYDFKTNRKFEMSVDVFPLNQGNKASIDFVSSITHRSTTYNYVYFPLLIDEMQPNTWNHFAFNFTIPEITNKKAVFKVYLWNNKKTEVFIDNLKVCVIKKKDK